MHLPKVLIVDDDQIVRTLMHYCLEGEAYSLIEARDGQEALEIAEREMPELILLDVMMPGPNGMAVLRQLKAQAHTRHISVIMLTALNHESQVTGWLDAGAIDHIGKPFSALMLRARVRAALRDRQQPATVCVA